jgi:hypothetical protein
MPISSLQHRPRLQPMFQGERRNDLYNDLYDRRKLEKCAENIERVSDGAAKLFLKSVMPFPCREGSNRRLIIKAGLPHRRESHRERCSCKQRRPSLQIQRAERQ